jgi:hypothetical protein
MKHSPSLGGAYLDFAAKPGDELSTDSFSNTDVFSASALKSLLDAPDGERPLVILDIARPAVTSEAVRQLLLRNAFANELFQIGGAASVLATGLGDANKQPGIWRVLTQTPTPDTRLGELATQIRQLALEKSTSRQPGRLRETGLDALIAQVGVALFTHDPTARAVPPVPR